MVVVKIRVISLSVTTSTSERLFCLICLITCLCCAYVYLLYASQAMLKEFRWYDLVIVCEFVENIKG